MSSNTNKFGFKMQSNASSTCSVMRVELEAAKKADTFYGSIVNGTINDTTSNVQSLLHALNSLWINRKNPQRIKKFAASVIIFGTSLYRMWLKSPLDVIEAINSSQDYNDCDGTGGWSVIMRILSHLVNRAMYRQRFIAMYMVNLLHHGITCASDRLLLMMTLENDVMSEFVSSHISLLTMCLSEYPSFYNCWILPPSDCGLPTISNNDIIRYQHDILCALIISRGGVVGLVGKGALHFSSPFNAILQRRRSSLSYATILFGLGGNENNDQNNIHQESSQQIIFKDTMDLIKLVLDNASDSATTSTYSL